MAANYSIEIETMHVQIGMEVSHETPKESLLSNF
jgi:hypothetical protein